MESFTPLSTTFTSSNTLNSKPKPMYQIRMETRLKRSKQNVSMGKKPIATQDVWKPGIINDIKQQHNCPSQTKFQERYKFKQEKELLFKGENKLMKNLIKNEEKMKYLQNLRSMSEKSHPRGKGECYDKVGATQSYSVGPLLNQGEGFL